LSGVGWILAVKKGGKGTREKGRRDAGEIN